MCSSTMDTFAVTQWTIYSMDSNTASHNDVDYSQKHKVGQKRKWQIDMYSMTPFIWPLNKCKTTLYVVSYIQKVSGKAERRLRVQFTPLQRVIYNMNIVRYRDI